MSGPLPLSACVIAKDEGDRIEDCLRSVSFCAEVLVLDSGSADDTVARARALGARVIETDWPGWVKQKNRAVQAARHDWILSLDADERVDPALGAAIEALVRGGALDAPGAPVAYEVTRKVHYLGRWIRHGGWYPQWRVRLFDRRHAAWGGRDPHDRVEVRGRVGRLGEGNLEHYTYRSMTDHLRQMIRFSEAAAEELYRAGRRRALWPMLVRPPFRFLRMYLLRRGFLDGQAGLVLAMLAATSVFLKYARLWDRVRRARAEGA